LMAKYTLRRLIQFIPTLFGVYTFAFFLMRVLPGDAATYLVGFHGSPEALAALHAKLHLDDPILVQYISFLGNLVRGDLGSSYITGDPVIDIVGRALPATAQLMVVATIISVAIGLPLGVISALRKDSIVDNLTRILVVLGASLPTFWLGIQL